MTTKSTPAQYVILLIDLVESLGGKRNMLLQGTTLSQTGIGGIGARVSFEDFTCLVHNALDITGDSGLGLKLGQRLNLSAHAVVGQAFLNCKNLQQVIELFQRFYHLLAPGLTLSIETGPQRSLMTISSPPEGLHQHFIYELLYGAILNTIRTLLNKPNLTLQMAFPYPEPLHSADYRELLGPDLLFDAMEGSISLDTNLLEEPLPSSNQALLALYEQECARLLADLEEDSSIGERTLNLLRKLEGHYPSMPQAAQMLNLGSRTYRRRLEQENESYQTILDKVRAEHATHYLCNTQLPLTTIAYQLGFNDSSNFRRAYIKWTGLSPLEARNN
ncbi:MAG: AraC family transcriptional regulator [Pseudomonadales bacterium]